MSVSPAPPAARAASSPARTATLLRFLVTIVCAGSAGVHAALIGPHIAEAGLLLGSAFAAAAVALALTALAVRLPRNDSWAPAAAAVVLCVIALSYLLSRTTGVPLLISDPEQLDPLGAATTAAEVAGAIAGIVLMSRKDRP